MMPIWFESSAHVACGSDLSTVHYAHQLNTVREDQADYTEAVRLIRMHTR